MAKNEKIVEASAIMLKELDSLRRQKREWELQRATLLAEAEFGNKRLKLHMEAYDALTIQYGKVIVELKRQITYNDELHKMLEVELPLHHDPVAQAAADEREVLDGPDDVDAERMQGTADHDPESLVGEEAYE